jgi:hypothetical protein
VGRPVSEATIRRRAELAYHRAQALARNEDFARALAELRRDGWTFGPDGVEDPGTEVWKPELRERAKQIRARARLVRLLLPDRLRALTVEGIATAYADHPLFSGVPGWDVVRLPRQRPGAWRAPDLVSGGDSWYAECAVLQPRLRTRHRPTLYRDVWQVHDRWSLKRRERGRERLVIQAVWPGQWVPRPHKTDMAPIHRRLYNRLKIGKDLIAAVYARRPPQKERRRSARRTSQNG